MEDRLKYTVKTFLNQADYNNLTTVSEGENKTEAEFIREAIKEALEKSLEKYRMYCH